MGDAGKLRPHRRIAPRRLNSRPMESEHTEAEINILLLPDISFKEYTRITTLSFIFQRKELLIY
jgi:hypothetical protein